MALTTDVVADPKEMIDPRLFNRLVRQITRDEQVDMAYATRVMRQALAFLKTCADNPDQKLSPSPAVDIGWHAFLLHTRDYAEFCERIAGRYIHHVPEDDNHHSGTTLDDTVMAMKMSGYEMDNGLWAGSGKCNQCYQGCHDSP